MSAKIGLTINGGYVTPMMTVSEVAYLLNVPSNTVRRWSDGGFIDAHRINHRGDRRFTLEDVARFRYNLLFHLCLYNKILASKN